MNTPRPYRSAATRDARRIRILAMVRNGARYDEIAGVERLSRERVRQIVVESLKRDDRGKEDHRRIQAARLEPALKLALEAIEGGRVEAIDRLLRVLNAQDKYLDKLPSTEAREDVRAKLIARYEMAAQEPRYGHKETPAESATP